MFRRVFTISYDPYSRDTVKYGKKRIPSLRLSGLWLTKKAGLIVGDKVLVIADTGKIAVVRIEKEKHDAE